MYNPNIHHRRSIRLKGYDYSQAGLYFITICCQNRICRFGHIENGNMILNDAGQIAHNEWLNTSNIRHNVELHNFIIMPNHIHGIIQLFGTGESHSPQLHSPEWNDPKLNPQTDAGESHSPQLHSPEWNDPKLNPHTAAGESHSPQLHSPEWNDPKLNPQTAAGESHSPQLHSPEWNDPKLNPQTDADESHSPQLHSPPKTNEFDSNDKEGVCKTPLRGPSQNIGAIVRGYKSSVTKRLGLIGIVGKIWQRNYHEHIIRNEMAYLNISEYITNNPQKWSDDTFFKT